jgi:lipid-binding SYLF domain-containing protein
MSRFDISRRDAVVAGASLALVTFSGAVARASSLEREADQALSRLYSENPKLRDMGAKAHAVLVFPKITKAGLMIGGQTGTGVLRGPGRPTAYYRISAVSYGFQAGVQTFSYALFFMTESSLDYLERSGGFSVGSGPSIVVVDEGFARTMNTTTLTQDVYAMIFGQRGLMAGSGLEGAKITQIDQPD